MRLSSLATVIHKFSALDRMSILEHALKIGVAKPAENAAELNEKLSIVPSRLTGKPKSRVKTEN